MKITRIKDGGRQRVEVDGLTVGYLRCIERLWYYQLPTPEGENGTDNTVYGPHVTPTTAKNALIKFLDITPTKGRPTSRSVQTCIRLTPEATAKLNKLRGDLSVSAYLEGILK